MTEKTARWTVTVEASRARLDKFLACAMPDESRSHIQVWIKKGQVLVNGSKTKTGYLIRPGDEISLHAKVETAGLPEPEDIPLAVIYEDSDIAVIDKPAGMVCHPGSGVRSGTLVNALLYHMGSLDWGDPQRPGIVHRLDRFTSGLVVGAKNGKAHRLLSRQFKQRQVTKEYLALVHGCLPGGTGVIDCPIGRDLLDRKKISVHARKKRAAVTRYEVEKNYGPVSLLRVKPETGRTHQIRVHLAQKGHPVVGDAVYGGNRDRSLPPALRDSAAGLKRYFLHACRLEFQHPASQERLSFAAPLPPELQEFIAILDRRAP